MDPSAPAVFCQKRQYGIQALEVLVHRLCTFGQFPVLIQHAFRAEKVDAGQPALCNRTEYAEAIDVPVSGIYKGLSARLYARAAVI